MRQKHLQAITAIFVLLLSANATRAQESSSAEWIVGQRDATVFAKTANESHDEFAKVCDDSGCSWILFADVPCTPKSTYNTLINSSTVHATTTVVCIAVTPTPAYGFRDGDLINRVIARAVQVSIALPLGDGLIRVSRFSLRGTPDALRQLPGEQVPAESHAQEQCSQLSAAYSSCKFKADKVARQCAVWHGPGRCPYSAADCVLPSSVDARCAP